MRAITKTLALSISLILTPHSYAVEKTTLDVALMNEDRYPYFVKGERGSPETGVYIDLLNKIGEMTDITFRYKYFPQSRVRHLMKYQKMDVEPGIAKEWRTEPLEQQNSIYSVPLFKTSEIIIYRKSLFDKIPVEEVDFKELIPCSVLGFYDVKIGESEERDKNTTTEANSAKMIELGRCDYMFIPLAVAQSADINSNLIGKTPVIKQFDLSLRLSKKNEDLLPKINSAIEKLVDDDYITKLFHKYKKLGEVTR